jgi:hypothetical protein
MRLQIAETCKGILWVHVPKNKYTRDLDNTLFVLDDWGRLTLGLGVVCL